MNNNNSGNGVIPMDWQPTANKDEIAQWVAQYRRDAADRLFDQAVMQQRPVEANIGDFGMDFEDLQHVGHLLQRMQCNTAIVHMSSDRPTLVVQPPPRKQV